MKVYFIEHNFISPAHYCAQMYCFVLKPKEPLWCWQTQKPPGRVHFAFAQGQTLTYYNSILGEALSVYA